MVGFSPVLGEACWSLRPKVTRSLRLSSCSSLGLVASELVVVGQLRSALERWEIVAAVVGESGEGGERERRRCDEVPPTQLQRVDPELDGCLIHQAFE